METIQDDAGPLAHEWLGRLIESGYRVTAKIQAIVEIITRSERALDAVAIFDKVRQEYPGLGLVTVYRTLQKLEELGLVQRLHQENGCNMVLRATQGHEHFLVCSNCGKVVYFSGDDLHKFTEQIASQTGFTIQAHWLQLFGLCSVCSDL
jgi:Fe2+ or Zn2+ uptake regulation protein